MNDGRVWRALVLLFLAPAALAAAKKDDDSSLLEVGLLFGRHDNYFFRGGDNPEQGSPLATGYLRGESQQRLASGKLELFGELSAAEASDIDNADYFAGTVGAKFKFGRSRITGEAFVRPSQVYFEEGDGVFFDQTGVEIGYRRDIKPGLWVGVQAELEQWRFDPEESERDADGHELSASLRVPLNPRLGIRATLIYEEKDSDAARFDVSGSGFAVALEAQPSDRVSIFARYKRREREYDGAAPDDRNFQRDDTVQDIVFNVRWEARETWGLRFEAFYRDGESTRPDRNYDGLRTLAGAFYRF